MQLASVVVPVVGEVAGLTAIATGHRDLGRSLVGLGILLIVHFIVWMRRTNLLR